MSAFLPIATELRTSLDVRFVPNCDMRGGLHPIFATGLNSAPAAYPLSKSSNFKTVSPDGQRSAVGPANQMAAILTPSFSPTVIETQSYRRALVPRAKRRPVMSRLAIAFVSALAATAANAQDTKSGQSHAPAVAGANGTRPFLFDGRMPGDGVRQGALADDHHPNAGAIVVPPKASQLGRER